MRHIQRMKTTSEFQNFSSKVLQDCGCIDRSLGADSNIMLRPLFQIPMYTANRKLEVRLKGGAERLGSISILAIRPFDFLFESFVVETVLGQKPHPT